MFILSLARLESLFKLLSISLVSLSFVTLEAGICCSRSAVVVAPAFSSGTQMPTFSAQSVSVQQLAEAPRPIVTPRRLTPEMANESKKTSPVPESIAVKMYESCDFEAVAATPIIDEVIDIIPLEFVYASHDAQGCDHPEHLSGIQAFLTAWAQVASHPTKLAWLHLVLCQKNIFVLGESSSQNLKATETLTKHLFAPSNLPAALRQEEFIRLLKIMTKYFYEHKGPIPFFNHPDSLLMRDLWVHTFLAKEAYISEEEWPTHVVFPSESLSSEASQNALMPCGCIVSITAQAVTDVTPFPADLFSSGAVVRGRYVIPTINVQPTPDLRAFGVDQHRRSSAGRRHSRSAAERQRALEYAGISS